MAKPIRLILDQPNHPANIGAAARAMKTMGQDSLYLVNPSFFPSPTANAMASMGVDILDRAVVTATLPGALQDCQLIFASSGRETVMDFPLLDLREAANMASTAQTAGQQVGFIFGTERTGLHNDQLKLCHYHVRIPTSDAFSSLNLAQAVQVVCYELLMATNRRHPDIAAGDRQDPAFLINHPLATHADTEHFYQRAEVLLHRVDFLKPGHAKIMLQKLRRLFQRAQLEKNEVIILQGIISNIERRLQ